MRFARTAALGAALAMVAAAAEAAPKPAHDVRIRRDEWGVPHILGRTDADAAYGLGYAQAEDDFATLVQATLTARGQLAAMQGPAGLDSDYLVQLLDVSTAIMSGRSQPMSAACCRPTPTG